MDPRAMSRVSADIGPQDQGADVETLQLFLHRFGYLPAPEPRMAIPLGRASEFPAQGEFDDQTRQALTRYQAFRGLAETGLLDAETRTTMAKPRCGFPDLFIGVPEAYAFNGGKWSKTDLRFHVLNASKDLTLEQVRTAVRAALDLWQAVSMLRFSETASASGADLTIRFGTGDHGCGHPFTEGADGKDNVLAHAFPPPPAGGTYAGQTHIDDADTWSVSATPKFGAKDLVTVVAHEVGHALGLSHSNVKTALMFPDYAGPHRHLDQDDIDAITALYGPKASA